MIKYFLFLFLVLLGGCAVGSDYKENVFVSDSNIQKVLNLSPKDAFISTDWYTIFNDEDLNTLLKFALKNNLSRQQAVKKLQQSRYQLAMQSKQFFPMFNASGNYTFEKANNSLLLNEDTNAFKVGFDASWEIDIWGKGQYITEQYFEFMKNSQYSLLSTNVSLTSEVILNYIKLRETQEKIRITQKNLSLQYEILNIIKNKYQAGTEDELALNQAQYTVEKTLSSIPSLELLIQTYKNNLASLLGITPNVMPVDLDVYKKNIISRTFKYSVKNLYNLPLNIIRTRPDILAAQATVKAQNAVVNEAITALYPSVNLNAAFNYLSSSGHSLFNTNSQVYGYSPSFSLPIWNWNQLKNNIEVQKYQKEIYLLNYNEIFLTALIELKNSIVTVEQTYEKNKHQVSVLSKMKNILKLTQQKYENGLIEFTDVATAEQDMLNTEISFIESNAEILQNLTAFYKATGGGYNFRE